MRYIIAIYLWTTGLIYFGLICIIGILLTFFITQEALDPWIKKMLRGLFKVLHVRVVAEGTEKIKPQKTYLFMANHVSIFDVPLLGAYIPTFVRGVEARRQFRWPFYGWAVRRLGNIPIDRRNIHAFIRSIRKAEKYLQRGKSMVILPEGHRTRDGKLRPFKKLPFFLVKQADVNITPIGLSGLFYLKPKNSWLIRPTTVKIKFGDIIPAEKIRSMSVIELKDHTRKEIQKLIERP